MDKRDRAASFRRRLAEAMRQADMSKSALARAVGADRSTLTQLLNEGETRLPNAQLVAEAAQVLGVSTDWLLALTDRPERPGDLVAAAMRIEKAERSSVDDQIYAWHQEAKGHKIRHVPATMPDILKTEEVLRWEYEEFLGKTPDQAIGATLDRLHWLRQGGSDYEIALPRHEVESLAAGEGYYKRIDKRIRSAQIESMVNVTAELYPTLRLFFFDAKKVFSSPVTVFGSLLAVVYVGNFYLAFRSEERVRSLTQHFDGLVRACDVDARDASGFLETLAARQGSAVD